MIRTLSLCKPNFIFASGLCVAIAACTTAPQPKNLIAQTTDPWWHSGRAAVEKRQAAGVNHGQAKNVILFIGDGMGVSTVTAARIFDGQSRGELGEENHLSFERFPNVALVKTYNTDSQVPDSAATASAMNTGVKTRFQSVGIWSDQPPSDCIGKETDFPLSLAELAESKGLSTGIVTTDKITYATPAAVYAHAQHRHWEDDTKLPNWAKEKGCIDIARQLVNFDYGDGIDVILGGGSESLLPVHKGGLRQDNRNLITEWQDKNGSGKFISNTQQLRQLNSQQLPSKLMGLFTNSHMSSILDKDLDIEPTLSEMTATAIDVLSSNKNGYFLMIENGLIDHNHHRNNAYRALTETKELSKAISTALSKVDLSNTLVLVTADHSHPFTLSGYSKRGNPILGHVKPIAAKGSDNIIDGKSLDINGAPYTSLGYRAGPKVRVSSNETKHSSHAEHDAVSPNYTQESAIEKPQGIHSGEDVALYAVGPQSYLVSGVMEQHVIFHIIEHALELKN